jgi:hypothetical protein
MPVAGRRWMNSFVRPRKLAGTTFSRPMRSAGDHCRRATLTAVGGGQSVVARAANDLRGHPARVRSRSRLYSCRPAGYIVTIQAIKTLLLDYKHRIRERYRFYSQDLINNLFSHPYTKIEFIQPI